MDTFYTTLPLRRVVNVLDDDSQMPYEVYECGHGGYLNRKRAKRRRCATCTVLQQPTPPICPQCFHVRRWDDLGEGCRDAVCDHCGRRGAWDA